MAYEERIAAAQAKMYALKEKMIAAEKVKAAHATKKEEISAAIEADITLLEAAEITAEYIEKHGEIEKTPDSNTTKA